MSQSNNNNRASLLAGLRTGGVRSASGPIMPHTAAPGGSFNIPRFASGTHPQPIYEDAGDGLDFGGQTLQYSGFNPYAAPLTAGFNDGRAPRFQHQQAMQQQQQLLRQAQFAMGLNPADQAQLLQMQMMQAMAQQQLVAEIALQQQAAYNLATQQQHAQTAATANRVPSSAGSTQTAFDVRSNAIAQLRSSRLSGIEDTDEHSTGPMTAALGGRFGSRSMPSGLNPAAPSFKLSGESDPNTPPTSTVVISGGTTIGGLNTPTSQAATPTTSKSDSAVSWRRGSTTAATSTVSRISPKQALRAPPSPPKVPTSVLTEEPRSTLKYRPQPLRIAGNRSPQVSAVAVGQEGEAPASPTSSNGSHSTAEATKKYEGVGMGRPQIAGAITGLVRVSQPVRQPRGPPAGAEDLGLKNFATRIKSRASIAGPLVRPTSGYVVEAY